MAPKNDRWYLPSDPTPLDLFLAGYLEAAVWASNDLDSEGGTTPIDETHDLHDFTAEAVAEARAECAKFMEENAADITAAMEATERDESWIGHDFWLTRNGHGAGFWDRGLGDLGDRLSKASEAYGSDHVLISGDRLEWLGG